MLYIHDTSCISPQPAFSTGFDARQPGTAPGSLAGENVLGPVDGFYKIVEPAYPGIPANVLRRMSKCVRLGVGATLPLLQQGVPDGIIIGTGNGGMEESVKFLRQIIDYSEGLLTPGHFVQSIPNAIASQIGLFNQNKGYNSTYVHRGLSFEHALIDAILLLRENAGCRYLVGGVDEFSGYHYQIELADGWYKQPADPNRSLYDYDSPGSIAGEGAALFLVGSDAANALAALRGVTTFHSRDERLVASRLTDFLAQYLPAGTRPALFLTGENGDSRALPFYTACETTLAAEVPVARFKHLCGEYPTASAFAVWLALTLEETLPQHMIKTPGHNDGSPYFLLYNNHKLSQHSFILLERFR